MLTEPIMLEFSYREECLLQQKLQQTSRLTGLPMPPTSSGRSISLNSSTLSSSSIASLHSSSLRSTVSFSGNSRPGTSSSAASSAQSRFGRSMSGVEARCKSPSRLGRRSTADSPVNTSSTSGKQQGLCNMVLDAACFSSLRVSTMLSSARQADCRYVLCPLH